MKNPAPYRYDIVGSFLRTKAIHEARSKFEAGEISAEELTKVEDAEITGLVKQEENVGLHAVTDGEYRRSFWHMDFLWGLTSILHSCRAWPPTSYSPSSAFRLRPCCI